MVLEEPSQRLAYPSPLHRAQQLDVVTLAFSLSPGMATRRTMSLKQPDKGSPKLL